MYARQIEDKELKFTFSGKLWNGNLVMRDHDSNSLWCHVQGKCVEGEYLEQRLELVPSVVTDWATWKEAYPESSVMDLPLPEERKKHFQADTAWLSKFNDDDFVAGIVEDGFAKSYEISDLTNNLVINDVVNEQPVAIVFDSSTKAVWCFKRENEGRVLEFNLEDGQLTDTETQQKWDWLTGQAVDGNDESPLVRHSIILVTKIAWEIFFPDSERWSD